MSLTVSVFLALAALACGDGNGGDGLVEPVSLQVSGTWSETSEVVADPCGLVDRLDLLARTLQLTQFGVQLRLIHEGKELGSGSLTPATGDFVLSGTYAFDGLTVSFVRRGSFSSPTRYTSGSDIVIDGGFVACEVRTTDEGVR